MADWCAQYRSKFPEGEPQEEWQDCTLDDHKYLTQRMHIVLLMRMDVGDELFMYADYEYRIRRGPYNIEEYSRNSEEK